jgi:hypothetical protein
MNPPQKYRSNREEQQEKTQFLLENVKKNAKVDKNSRTQQ